MKVYAERYIHTFSSLSPDNLPALATIFASDARFKDPFNDVRGIGAIQQVFAHMYATTRASHFFVREWAVNGNTLFIRWDYHFQTLQGKPWEMAGTSVVHFAENGLAVEHIDYWDTAEQLYAKLPLLSWLMKWLRNKLSTPQS